MLKKIIGKFIAIVIFAVIIAAISFGGFSDVSCATALPETYISQWFDAENYLDYTGTLSLINSQIKNNENLDYYAENPIIIAVIDTGLDTSSTVFDGLLFQNATETADGIDNDGNGYIDDTCGWDFVNNDNNPYDDCAKTASNPKAADSHGTHVAGIIAKEIINYGLQDYIKILPLKAGNYKGSFSSGLTNDASWATAAVNYAVSIGANVINMSFTAPISGTNNKGWGKGEALDNALQTAHNAGVTLVAAAGNTTQQYVYQSSKCSPAVLDNVIGVMNMDEDGDLADTSVRSDIYYDVAAPGTNIISTVRESYNGSSVATTYDGNKFAEKSGTSMATPLVSFMAAVLMIKYDCARNDNITFATDTVNYVMDNCTASVINNIYKIASLKTYLSYDPVSDLQIEKTEGELVQKMTALSNITFNAYVRMFSSAEFSVPNDEVSADIKWYVKPCDATGNPIVNKAAKTYTGATLSYTPTEPGNFLIYAKLGNYNSASNNIIVKINYALPNEVALSIDGLADAYFAKETYVLRIKNLDQINPSTSVYWIINKDGEYLSTVSGKQLVFYPAEKGTYDIECKLSTGETVQIVTIKVKNDKTFTASVVSGVVSGIILVSLFGLVVFTIVKNKRKAY